jgi:hypothetical protein
VSALSPRETWIGDDKVRRRLDQRVLNDLRPSLRGLADQRPPHTVSELCDDLLLAWDKQAWFLATCACALLGELFFASGEGGTFAKARPLGGEIGALRRALESLRNACFHPAHIKPLAEGGPHALQLAVQIERYGAHQLAARLKADFKQLRSRHLAEQAMRWTVRLGELLLEPPSARRGG